MEKYKELSILRFVYYAIAMAGIGHIWMSVGGGNNYGHAHVISDEENDKTRRNFAKLTSLNYLLENDSHLKKLLKRALVCKMDVEGHEMNLINSGLEFFKEYPCCVMKAEILGSISQSKYLGFIRSLGYEVFPNNEYIDPLGKIYLEKAYKKDGGLRAMSEVYFVQKDLEACVQRVFSP